MVCHKEYPVYEIQFHPESILTEMGMRILENFFNKQHPGSQTWRFLKGGNRWSDQSGNIKPHFLTKIVKEIIYQKKKLKAMDQTASGMRQMLQMGSF